MQIENTEDLDYFDFCLQSSDKNIILTILVNGNPLYDCLIDKHVKLASFSEQEKKEYILSSYFFDVYPEEEMGEEALFYHNFPSNVSPVDCKHYMVGLDVKSSFLVFASKHINSEIFNLPEKLIFDDSIDELVIYKKEQRVVCLTCTCGIVCCGNISMKINVNNGKVSWTDFYRFNENFHEEVTFSFEENQYLSVLSKIKQLVDNLKTYQDYQNWLISKYLQNGY